jgi:hypothetical protein
MVKAVRVASLARVILIGDFKRKLAHYWCGEVHFASQRLSAPILFLPTNSSLALVIHKIIQLATVGRYTYANCP